MLLFLVFLHVSTWNYWLPDKHICHQCNAKLKIQKHTILGHKFIHLHITVRWSISSDNSQMMQLLVISNKDTKLLVLVMHFNHTYNMLLFNIWVTLLQTKSKSLIFPVEWKPLTSIAAGCSKYLYYYSEKILQFSYSRLAIANKTEHAIQLRYCEY